MKAKPAHISLLDNNIIRIALGTMLLLLIPLLAMQFTNEVEWNLIDFTVAGTLLFGTGLAYELITRKVRSTKYRAAVGAVLVTALILIWVELAVGIFD